MELAVDPRRFQLLEVEVAVGDRYGEAKVQQSIVPGKLYIDVAAAFGAFRQDKTLGALAGLDCLAWRIVSQESRKARPVLLRQGASEQKRDFIYVKDVARMTCAFLSNDEGGLYNIGTGHASSWNDLARAVFKALGKPAHIEYIDMPTDLLGKYQNYTCADMRRTQKALKGVAKCDTLENSVGDYIRNYLLLDKRW